MRKPATSRSGVESLGSCGTTDKMKRCASLVVKLGCQLLLPTLIPKESGTPSFPTDRFGLAARRFPRATTDQGWRSIASSLQR